MCRVSGEERRLQWSSGATGTAAGSESVWQLPTRPLARETES